MAISQRPRWLDRWGLFSLLLLLCGVVGGGLRLLPGMSAFGLFALGGISAIPVALWFLIRRVRGFPLGIGGASGLLAAVVFAAAAGLQPSAPSINDFTTDLSSVPEFTHARTLPANLGRDLTYPPSFRAIQRDCCADLGPQQSPAPAVEVFRAALQTARAMPGWTITSASEERGTIEAVSETQIFGFRDDVVIRISPGDGTTRIDMRSKSRDGQGDIGANAARIRAYQDALRLQLPAGP